MIDIYVINLVERIDRKTKLLETYKKYQDINLIFIEAIKHDKGATGCFMSHQKCLEIAKNKNLDYIIVLEDDTIPVENINFYDELVETISFLQTLNTWDIFLGIGNKIKPTNIQKVIKHNNNNYIITNKSFTLNLVIYNKTIYDFFLNAASDKEPIDVYWNYKLDAIIRIPYFVKTYKTYSDIEKKTHDYNGAFDRTQKNILHYLENNLKT